MKRNNKLLNELTPIGWAVVGALLVIKNFTKIDVYLKKIYINRYYNEYCRAKPCIFVVWYPPIPTLYLFKMHGG